MGLRLLFGGTEDPSVDPYPNPDAGPGPGFFASCLLSNLRSLSRKSDVRDLKSSVRGRVR